MAKSTSSVKVLFDRVCGLDVHRDTVAACVRTPGPGSTRQEVVQTFGTMTADLLALLDWLKAHGVTHVAMEATGVYWKPVYYLLENHVTVLLVNPGHMKNVPGRKTDVADSAWVAQLLECGLLRGSFVPPAPIRELRDLTRYRRTLIRDRVRTVQRLHKVLQDASIKLSSVAADIMGVSGRAMIEALVQGTKDAKVLAELAKGRLRSKLAKLRQALEGRFSGHHAFLVGELLAQVDYLDEVIGRLNERIEEAVRPFAKQVDRLDEIHGIGAHSAEEIVAEIGVDMTPFATSGHIASWAAVCPGNNESAGKHKSGKTRKGNRWLRSTLVECAQASTRAQNNYFGAQYRRIVRHRGHKKAIFAVAHSMLVTCYHILRDGTTYQDLGADYFEQRNKLAVQRRCVRQLQRLGYSVELQPQEAVA